MTSMSLDRIKAECKPVSAAHPFICVLPPPISVNEMYGQAPGRRRFHSKQYSAWIEDASMRLRAARPPKFTGQVWIAITYSQSSRLDIDNGGKGILDLLVAHHVIKNDNKTYVRELRLSWGINAGARVEVRPFPFNSEAA